MLWLGGACHRVVEVVGPAAVEQDAATAATPSADAGFQLPGVIETPRPACNLNTDPLCAGAPPLPAPEWNCGDRCFRASDVPAEAQRAFLGPVDTNATLQPRIVYPLKDSLHAANLSHITLQWWRAPGDQQRLFRFVLLGPSTRYELYVPCDQPAVAPLPPQEQCIYTVPSWLWLHVAKDNQGETLSLQVFATNAPGASVFPSEATTIAFSPSHVSGGFYYWAPAQQDKPDWGTIFRMVFGGEEATPFIAPETAANPTKCGGCHTISRDGSLIAFTADEANGRLYLGRTDDPAHPVIAPINEPAIRTSMSSLSANGALLLVSYGDDDGSYNGRLAVLRTRDGQRVATLDPQTLGFQGRVFFPEWSPDGTQIAMTVSSIDVKPWSVRNGSIAVVGFREGGFHSPRVLVRETPEYYHFYPTWSPDGRWVAFVSGRHGEASYYNRDTHLRMVRVADGHVVNLPNASMSNRVKSTWPKFAPFMQGNNQIMFLTFNSLSDYGFVRPNSATANLGWPQLWMAGIDLRRLAEDPHADPSLPPVWLPFQSPRTHNHLGFWTEQLRCRPDAPAGSPERCGREEVCDAELNRCVLRVL